MHAGSLLKLALGCLTVDDIMLTLPSITPGFRALLHLPCAGSYATHQTNGAVKFRTTLEVGKIRAVQKNESGVRNEKRLHRRQLNLCHPDILLAFSLYPIHLR